MFSIRKRPVISPLWFCALVSFYLVMIFNRSFWRRAFDYFHHDYGVLAVIFITIVSLFMVFHVAFSVKYLLKPWAIMLIFSSAIASWFTDQFGTIIDRHMLVNVMETTGPEASHLITVHFMLYLIVFAFVPSMIILWIRLGHRPFFSTIWRNFAVISLCLGLAVSLSMIQARTVLSTLREHNDLMRIINPIAPLTSMIKYVVREHLESDPAFQMPGQDAQIIRPFSLQTRPRVVIMVIGEAARAENFSLQGYGRQTNPQLENHDIIYFGNVSSCGTATAQSVPCMFSHLPKEQFNRRAAVFMSTLPDILAHLGMKVTWWENNSDSKGVANRIEQVMFYGGNDADFCSEGECLDGIMLQNLDDWLDTVTDDAMLFIHQMGSHGPAYFKRYPQTLRHFQPDCREAEFSHCSNEEIVNAYDNSLLYTDYFLSQIIDKLAARENGIESALFYMSDHGESLGEKGLYLHGMPYALAPSQQTHIPFVLWLSENLTHSLGLDLACLTQDAMIRPLSHDNLFPSLLSVMDIKTKIKDEALDILSPCRQKVGRTFHAYSTD